MAEPDRRRRPPQVVTDEYGTPIVLPGEDATPEEMQVAQQQFVNAESEAQRQNLVNQQLSGPDERTASVDTPEAFPQVGPPMINTEGMGVAQVPVIDLPPVQIQGEAQPGGVTLDPIQVQGSVPAGQVQTRPAQAAPTAEQAAEEQDPGKVANQPNMDAYSHPSELYGTYYRQGQLGMQAGKEQEQYAQEVARLQAERTQQLDDFANQILDARERMVADTRRAIDEAQTRTRALYSQQFDPSRIYHSPDRAASVGVHLGVAVGAMLQSISNGLNPGQNAPNAALQIVESAIDRDIAQQREMFRRGEIGIDRDLAAMEAMRVAGMDEADAFTFARSAAVESVASQLESIASAHEGTQFAIEVRARAEQLRQQAIQSRIELEMRAAQVAAQRVRRSGGGSGVASHDTLPGGIDISEARTATDVIFVPSEDPDIQRRQRAYAADKNTQTRVTDAIMGLRSFEQLLNDLDQLVTRDEQGGFIILPENEALAQVYHSNLATALKTAKQMGAYDDGVKELVDEMVGSLDDLYSDPSALLVRLRANARIARREQQEWMQANGLSMRQRQPDRMPTAEELANNITNPDRETNVLETARAQGDALADQAFRQRQSAHIEQISEDAREVAEQNNGNALMLGF